MLPSGAVAIADPVGNEEAYIVRGQGDGTARRAASWRRQVIEAADAERARLARDLHDGAQQRLVQTVMALKETQRALAHGDGAAEALVGEALEQAQQANTELRELAHGISPAVLRHGGLRAGLEALASRVPLPVALDVSVDRLAQTIEAHAYFIVSEALTNIVKHSRASTAEVRAAVSGDTLRVEVRDDGIGGARMEGSSGLLGLDRPRQLAPGRASRDEPRRRRHIDRGRPALAEGLATRRQRSPGEERAGQWFPRHGTGCAESRAWRGSRCPDG